MASRNVVALGRAIRARRSAVDSALVSAATTRVSPSLRAVCVRDWNAKSFSSMQAPKTAEGPSADDAAGAAVEGLKASAPRARRRVASLKQSLEEGPDFSDFVVSSTKPSSRGAKRDAAEAAANRRRSDPPKPSWLRVATPTKEARENFERLQTTVRSLNLATVCEEARCPNQTECWGGADAEGTATATIMIMGDTCTRGCSFCNVKTSNAPPPLDPLEPDNVATAIAEWGLDYVVLTSVDRDELEDQGSEHFAATVRRLKELNEDVLVECLTPDFRGDASLVAVVAKSGLDVFAHNLETVKRLQGRVRDRRAGYEQSVGVLRAAKEAAPHIITKTSLMLGLGETEDEVRECMADLREAGVDVVTFGQYLRPTPRHIPVHEYVTPEAFKRWEVVGKEMGFAYVASGPLVRSSYRAGEFFIKNVLKKRREEEAGAAGVSEASSL